MAEGLNTVRSLFSSEMQIRIDDPLETFDLELLSFKFDPVYGPVNPGLQRPWYTNGAADKPHYGLGGFHRFSPEDRVLSIPARLTITYYDDEISDIDENSLAIYRWNEEKLDWDYIGGGVDIENNAVTAPVDRLGLYTVGPAMPAGTIYFTPQMSEGNVLTATFVSDPITMNTGQIVPDGTRFTVHSIVPNTNVIVQAGTTVSTDEDSQTDGVQVSSSGGVIQFTVEYRDDELSLLAGRVRVVAYSDEGTALADQDFSLD